MAFDTIFTNEQPQTRAQPTRRRGCRLRAPRSAFEVDRAMFDQGAGFGVKERRDRNSGVKDRGFHAFGLISKIRLEFLIELPAIPYIPPPGHSHAEVDFSSA